jgi:GH25 family lysozyme M1 (1,4-beta-N-acetylmuramidase)
VKRKIIIAIVIVVIVAVRWWHVSYQKQQTKTALLDILQQKALSINQRTQNRKDFMEMNANTYGDTLKAFPGEDTLKVYIMKNVDPENFDSFIDRYLDENKSSIELIKVKVVLFIARYKQKEIILEN